MMWDRKSTGILFFALLTSTLYMGAAPALNPRVTRAAKPAPVAVPDECRESLAPAPAPRVDVREFPRAQYVALDLEAPRTTDLRTTLRDAQDALRRNDRGDFDATLTRTRTLLATYPPGAERRGAEELLRIYEDAALVWDAQFESPFFDASAPLYARLSTYPGWADAVRRNTLMDDHERRFFPAAESRVFLATVAADRLSRLGIRATAPASSRTSAPRIATDERRAPRVTSSKPATTQSSTSRTTTKRPSSSTAARSSSTPARSGASSAKSTRKETPATRTPEVARPSTRTAASPPAAPKSASTSPSTVAAKPASSTTTSSAVTPAPPAAIPVPAASTSASTPASSTQPAPSETPAPATPSSGSFGDTNATGTATASDPLATDTAATSSGEGAETIAPSTSSADSIPATPTRTRSLLLPIILILIGLGVLIVLFRASN